jgi:NhaP-type Na+/H+ or K+/H+ antiporter
VLDPLLAADKGFSFADPYAVIVAFAGFAVFAAIGALSHQHERAFSASVIYLGLGLLAAMGINAAGVTWLDPKDNATLLEHLAELAIIIALFSAGLKVERPLERRSWGSVARLLLFAMPLTIAAVALVGDAIMGLSLGAAIALGAALAPTDPVLAGDIGIGPPGEEDEREPHFSITAEAGLNDGLAFPFVFLALFVAEKGGTGWLGEWLVADVGYAIGVGVLIGGLGGYVLAALAVRLRDRELLSHDFDGWLAIGVVLLVYGVTEIAGGYGFLAAFAAGLGFRRYEHTHEVNRRVHDGAEMVEKFGELALILLLGSMVTLDGLEAPGLTGWLLVPLLLLLIRPISVLLGLLGSPMDPPQERYFVAWFGVRGIGSLYYAAVIVGSGVLPDEEALRVFWTVAACVIVSIVVHGVTSSPVERRLLGRDVRH